MEKKGSLRTEEIFFAGGCLWGVQEFIRHLPGVASTEAGRANGSTGLKKQQGEYDGYAECVRTLFYPDRVSVRQLMGYFFEIIDPQSLDQQVDKSNQFKSIKFKWALLSPFMAGRGPGRKVPDRCL